MAPEIRPGARMLIVGGGYIGLEAAAVAAQRGLSVTLVEMAPRILGRVACAGTAGHLRDLHRRHGVDIREGIGLARLETGPKGRVGAAVLADGTRLAVDIVVTGIGIAPDTALAEAAGLAIDNAGDCASFPYHGGRIRLESVQNAIDQGTHAARAMLGATAAYDPVPWFWSDQYDAKLQIVGLNAGHDRVVERPGHRPGGRSFWYFAGSRLLAVDAIADTRAYMQAKRWIEAGVSPNPDALADPGRALVDLV